jgi:hypothetical protein
VSGNWSDSPGIGPGITKLPAELLQTITSVLLMSSLSQSKSTGDCSDRIRVQRIGENSSTMGMLQTLIFHLPGGERQFSNSFRLKGGARLRGCLHVRFRERFAEKVLSK